MTLLTICSLALVLIGWTLMAIWLLFIRQQNARLLALLGETLVLLRSRSSVVSREIQYLEKELNDA
jgi:hypothetical protein